MGYKEYQEGKYTVRIYDNGNKQWFLNRKLHREDGTAVEYANGTKYWYINDKLHRENGPAKEYPDGYKAWYLNSKRYTKETFYSIMWNKLSRQDKLDYIYGL